MSDGLRYRPDVATLSQWGRGTAGLVFLVAATLFVLEFLWIDGPPVAFLFAVGVAVGFEGVVFLQTVARARRTAGKQPFTLATWVTVTRGVPVAILAGFVLVPPPSTGGAIAWLPVALFALAAGLDAVDGLVARATGAVTELGSRLDVEMDGLVVLVGTLVGLSSGSLPLAFLAVALARYLFVAGIWWRKRRGRRVLELPPNRFRRPLGALAMLTVAIALLPVVDPWLSRIVALVVVLPFVLNFWWDWLAVTGRVSSQ
ncbi:CDP-alcohol phosphatidyltransferase family protein [Natronobacterium texcoconense]|uniref:CDP-diacylglycerol--glycerol-3-phosphate 3-phosphatidyltransferase n=1 Tax=Natronobacterium texcoconense TaxID=1095778 RepID=A0A1H1EUJ4_NATTX|nr:CDP-alcohol phosphatidyltransferase family protein [Natronobacterium texcoconense]SDQ92447.1 CDP-diacylglycerol--glycerol-3-phosphate 3-phosphatidyltransferase [Natronobacterium texcoconense]